MKFLIAFVLSLVLFSGTLVQDIEFVHQPNVSAINDPTTTNDVRGPVEAVLVSEKKSKIVPGAALNGPSALTVLEALPVKGKAPATGYDRNKKFGNGWKDFNGNKCDERQDTLKRDMSSVKYKDLRKCQLSSGTLSDSYTGTTIRWKVNSGSVDIDHVVALKNVWISGGQRLADSQRLAIANDPLNLMASQASANRSKGDANAAEWLPRNKSFRCRYIATQISVKKKYALTVTAAEKTAMKRVLSGCKKQKAAKVTSINPSGKTPAATPQKQSAPKSKPTVTTPKIKSVSPGAFCAKADKGKKGLGKKSGKSYTCKTSKSDTRLRWR